jgi:hypothetical protein
MDLFTSSFKRYVSIFSAVFLAFVGLHIIVVESRFCINGGGVGTTEFQSSVIRGQRYLYDLKNPDILLVGASLTGRIRAREMGPRVYNLAWPFLTGLSALRVVAEKSELPKTVLVQVHQMLAVEPAMEDVLLDPMWLSMRDRLPLLRQEFKPTALMKFILLDSLLGRDHDEWFLPQRIERPTGQIISYSYVQAQDNFARAKASLPSEIAVADARVRAYLDRIVTQHYRPFFVEKSDGNFEETEMLTTRISQLKQIFEDLKSRGNTRVVLNKIEMGPEVERLPIYNKFLEVIAKNFAGYEWLHITGPDFRYIDDLHMEERTSYIYTEKLMEYLKIKPW